MILAVDVHYKDQKALVAGVLFENWDDDYPCEIFMSTVSNIEKYEPGQFYKRELPCILKLLEDEVTQQEISHPVERGSEYIP